MKKTKNKKILPVLIFLFILTISSNVASAVLELQYWWFANEKGVITGDSLNFWKEFSSLEKCNTGRIKYINSLSTIPDKANVGDCEQRNSDKTILKSNVNTTKKIVAPKNTTKTTTPSPSVVKDNPVSLTPGKDAPTANTVYKLLAPLPGFSVLESSTNIGKYLNIMITIIIGLCAVLAVVMLVVGGVQYMGSESVFGKIDAKGQMTKAIFGLLIAIGAFALLNTINPALLGKNGLKIKQVSAEIIENFQISGAATIDGSAINVDFNTEAYPAAKIASQETGVDTAFILAMFAQETSNGSNTGRCTQANANMGEGQLASLMTVMGRVKSNYSTKYKDVTWQNVNMSCSGGGSTHGGAIGFTQFLPGTWLQYSDTAKTILGGREPDPWNASDALMMTALFLKGKGGAGTDVAKQTAAACSYFGSCDETVSCGSGVTGTYGQCIIAKKASIQKQIDAAIAKKEII